MDFENRLHIDLNGNSFHWNWMIENHSIIITWNQYKLSCMTYILCVCGVCNGLVRFIVSRNFRENILTKSLYDNCTVYCEKRELHSQRKKFRQINYLVISLVKLLFPRNFCEKSVRENFCTFHTTTVWKLQKFTLTFLAKVSWK